MITFDHLSKSYGDQLALADLSASIGRGEIVALLGPNGAGKTTALKAAAGLIQPTSGAVLIDGRKATLAAARNDVCYLPQRVDFAESLTGREVVEFYRRLRGTAVDRGTDALRLVSLNGAGSRPVGSYSVGMIQRLALAVSAVSDASILLLDEPTAALDPEGLEAFYTLARERQSGGGSVLFSSHQLGDAERLADRFVVLVAGRAVAILERNELTSRLAARGMLHLRVSGRETSLRATAEERPAILDRIRSEGGIIESITADEGRLDDLYADLVAGGPQ